MQWLIFRPVIVKSWLLLRGILHQCAYEKIFNQPMVVFNLLCVFIFSIKSKIIITFKGLCTKTDIDKKVISVYFTWKLLIRKVSYDSLCFKEIHFCLLMYLEFFLSIKSIFESAFKGFVFEFNISFTFPEVMKAIVLVGDQLKAGF